MLTQIDVPPVDKNLCTRRDDAGIDIRLSDSEMILTQICDRPKDDNDTNRNQRRLLVSNL